MGETTDFSVYAYWLAGLLLAGGGLLALSGGWILYRGRGLSYFRARRETLLRGWQLLAGGGLMVVLAGLTFGLGPRVLPLLFPPTRQPVARPSPTVTAATPATPASRRGTATPSAALPTASLAPHLAGSPTVVLTPVLPSAFITPILTPTITPPAEAVAADMRFALGNNCATTSSVAHFGPQVRTIYAHFYYDNWLRGVQWSGVWYHEGKLYFIETLEWDGSTGGCGFTSYDNAGQPWPAGRYEVQIFIGARWLLSSYFSVVAPTATPAP